MTATFKTGGLLTLRDSRWESVRLSPCPRALVKGLLLFPPDTLLRDDGERICLGNRQRV